MKNLFIASAFVFALCRCDNPSASSPGAPDARLQGAWSQIRGRALPELVFEGSQWRRYGTLRVRGQEILVEAVGGNFTFDGNLLRARLTHSTCRLEPNARREFSFEPSFGEDLLGIRSDIYTRVTMPTDKVIRLGCFTGDRFFETGLNPVE